MKSLSISEKLFDEKNTDEFDVCLMLHKLYLCTHDVTSTAVLKLFSGISSCKYSRLTLFIREGNFTDDKVAYEIATYFQQNDVILRAELYSFRVSDEASCTDNNSITSHNNTLQHLDMRIKCSYTLENKIDRIILAINTERCLSDKYLPKIHYNFDYFGSLIIQL